MTELVILSGKGGTGKTSVTAAFASLAQPVVLVDCDVDAADLHLVMAPEVRESQDFIGGKTARMYAEKCVGCGRCLDLCRFGAVLRNEDVYEIDPVACEGCGVCAKFCPHGAIAMEECVNGQWFVSETRVGPMVHARLGPGEENSGKLVATIREKARDVAKSAGNPLILTDGPPGIGCPVIASLSGADAVLIVTEPSVSGIHDMKRVAKLAAHFKAPACILINKSDINAEKTAEISRFASDHGLPVVGELPYDPVVTKAQLVGKSVVEFGENAVSNALRETWERVSSLFIQTESKAGSPAG